MVNPRPCLSANITTATSQTQCLRSSFICQCIHCSISHSFTSFLLISMSFGCCDVARLSRFPRVIHLGYEATLCTYCSTPGAAVIQDHTVLYPYLPSIGAVILGRSTTGHRIDLEPGHCAPPTYFTPQQPRPFSSIGVPQLSSPTWPR